MVSLPGHQRNHDHQIRIQKPVTNNKNNADSLHEFSLQGEHEDITNLVNADILEQRIYLS